MTGPTDTKRAREIRNFALGILHGDAEHQQWLMQAAEAFIEGRPIPKPRGKGNTEALIAQARLDAFREAAEMAEAEAERNSERAREHGNKPEPDIQAYDLAAYAATAARNIAQALRARAEKEG